jgi:PleD family two-component response regulator
MKILLIDQDNFILDMYERALVENKAEVVKARDAKTGLAVLQNSRPLPDAIIMEVLFDDMDGFALLSQIKGDPNTSNIPVVVLSNLYSREDRKKGIDMGASLYRVKSEHEPKQIVDEVLALAA